MVAVCQDYSNRADLCCVGVLSMNAASSYQMAYRGTFIKSTPLTQSTFKARFRFWIKTPNCNRVMKTVFPEVDGASCDLKKLHWPAPHPRCGQELFVPLRTVLSVERLYPLDVGRQVDSGKGRLQQSSGRNPSQAAHKLQGLKLTSRTCGFAHRCTPTLEGTSRGTVLSLFLFAIDTNVNRIQCMLTNKHTYCQ